MALDPVTIIGLASAVVQFVDFGTKLISKGKELYVSLEGASEENLELEKITEDLKQLSDNLLPSSTSPRGLRNAPKNDLELQKIAEACKKVADELLDALKDIKVKSIHKKWESFYQAFRGVMKEKKIQGISARLDRLQKQAQLRLVVILNEQQSDAIAITKKLAANSKRLETQMTDKLDVLQTELSVVVGNLARMESVSSLFLDQLSLLLSEKLSELENERSRISKSLKILESLRYTSMTARLSDVKEEHAETFQWIFDRQRDATYRQPNFVEWLERQDGIYWVAGKAGSGKSTLMKYLCFHKATLRALQNWAGSERLIMATHFFWNSSNAAMQMSQAGLLRSLLYQALKQCPELILYVCKPALDDRGYFEDSWTLQKLLKAFERLADQTLEPVKMCFFIDGLDEFDGEPSDVIRLFTDSAKSKQSKFCLSSRPWNIFDDAFGTDESRKLMLQDLTRNDIRIYVYDKLGVDPRFRNLAADDERYKDLIQQIVEKAQGVFLWVVLVVRSLLNGLTDDNDIPDMQRRVDMLPSDLEKYFKHMLDGIEDVYRSQTAQIFQLCVCARGPLPVTTFTFLEKERANPDYAIEAERRCLTVDDMAVIRGKMKKYLNARCKGLLEINYDADKSFSLNYKVDFLHRTVKEFLRSKEIQGLLQLQLPPNFDTNLCLCRASLAQIKLLQPDEVLKDGETSVVLSGLTVDLMAYAKEIELQYERPSVGILDELDRFHALYTKDADMYTRALKDNDAMIEWEEIISDSLGAKFLAWAIEAGLYLYASEKLERHPELLQALLEYALRYGLYGKYMDLDSRILKLLLQDTVKTTGASGGEENKSVWDRFLDACEACRQRGYNFWEIVEASAKMPNLNIS